MSPPQNSGKVPSERLAQSLLTIAEKAPEGESAENWTTLCLALAGQLGRRGKAYKNELGLPSKASEIAWEESGSVPAVLSFSVDYNRDGGKITGRERTDIRVADLVISAKGDCNEIGVDYVEAAKATAKALSESKDRAEASRRLERALERDDRPERGPTPAEAPNPATDRSGAGGKGSEAGEGEGGRGANGLGNRGGEPHPNRRSERSDLRSEVDICFANPPVKERCNRQQWEALVGRTSSIQQQWVALDLIEKARSAHYSSGEDEEDGWVVMESEKLVGDFKVSYPTRTVYENCPIIEAKDDGSYVSPQRAEEQGVDPQAREMRISEDFLQLWTRLSEEGGMRRYKAHHRELVRTTEPQPMTTDLYDENRHEVPELVKGALEVLQDADHEVILEAIEEAEEAIAGQEGAEARHQLTSLRLAKETVERQVIQAQGGVAHLQNAYKIQEISGRVSFKRGGPQGLMGEVKAKAYDIEGYRNFDIKSCHTAALKEVADTLAEMGVEIDVSPWTEYAGKDAVVADTGLPRSLVKVVEHAVKYGAVLPASMEQVKDFYVEDDEDADDPANWPSVAREVHEHAQKGLLEDRDKALSTLCGVFGDMRRVVVEMAEALLTDYYEASHSGGWMENACGVSFAKHNYEEGHEQRSKVMAWMLQGLEAAFCHHLTILSAESGAFSVVANEHDGLIIRKEVEGEERFQSALNDAIQKAQDRSGFARAKLVEKAFADQDDIAELYGAEAAESGAEADEQELEPVVKQWLRRKRSRPQAPKSDAHYDEPTWKQQERALPASHPLVQEHLNNDPPEPPPQPPEAAQLAKEHRDEG